MSRELQNNVLSIKLPLGAKRCLQNKSQNSNNRFNKTPWMRIHGEGLQESVDAVFVDLWRALDVRDAVRKGKTWVSAHAT